MKLLAKAKIYLRKINQLEKNAAYAKACYKKSYNNFKRVNYEIFGGRKQK